MLCKQELNITTAKLFRLFPDVLRARLCTFATWAANLNYSSCVGSTGLGLHTELYLHTSTAASNCLNPSVPTSFSYNPCSTFFSRSLQSTPLAGATEHTRAQYLWMPEHSMHSRMPRLMLAQRGSGWPQSQHWSFPGMLCTLCKMVSPFTLRSRESVAESMLLVDGEAVRSSLCGEQKGV